MFKLIKSLNTHNKIFIRCFCTPNTKQDYGSSLAIPVTGALELLNTVPPQTVLVAAYVGATSTAVLSLVSYAFKDIIGFIYISEDNKYIKISSLSYWGKRKDKIIPVDDWTPIMDMKSKPTDILYLKPEIADGSKYKLCVKFGTVHDAIRMGSVLE